MTSQIPDWYTTRSYLHFDSPISKEKAIKIVTTPEIVAQHAFYPFIKFITKKRKITKENGKPIFGYKDRDISYASHIDSHIFAYYASILTQHYEKKLQLASLHNNILAFRKVDRKSNINFAHDAFTTIQNMAPCAVLALDFSKFFDTLDHHILKQAWADLLQVDKLPLDHYKVFRAITKFSTIDLYKIYKALGISQHTPRAHHRYCLGSAETLRKLKQQKLLISGKQRQIGIPQGSPISALLSNIYMLEFDLLMKKKVSELSGQYYRYCDDMLFIIPQNSISELESFAISTIKQFKVTINADKTEKRFFTIENGIVKSKDENQQYMPLQYLGFLFTGTNTYLRPASLHRYSEKMKGGVRLAKATMKRKNNLRRDHSEPKRDLYKRKLHRLYSYRGKRNFISYGYRAASIMNSKTIRKQLKPLWKKLQSEIQKANPNQ